MPAKHATSPKKVAKKIIKGKSVKSKKEKVKGPKRPTSAYIFYSTERRNEIVKANPALKSDVGGVAKATGAEWRGLSASQKSKYEALAAKDRLRYENEKEAAK